MHRLFTLIAGAALLALSFVGSLAVRAANFMLDLIPDLTGAKAAFMLDNGHPRSPLASMRAGLA